MDPSRPHPLSQGNRLQRAYARWAGPHYARMAPAVRSEAERLDGWLYSRRALGLWLGLAGAVAGTTGGLRALGMPLALAAAASLVVWLSLLLGLLGAWLQPDKFSGRRLWRGAAMSLLLAYMGLVCGFLVGQWSRQGSLKTDTLAQTLGTAMVKATPYVLPVLLLLLALSWGVAQVRQRRSDSELQTLRLAQERDSAERQAAQAQLRLLQAQIQPHFLFNTLAAVQHWVDTADPRAGPLLRALTQFLRGSTELLGREQATLAEEAALAGHYLAILQARLGGRLRSSIAIDPRLAQQTLPPGLLLTLVENAVEHGITPALQGGTVRVHAQPLPQGWQLSVCDDGAGLRPGWQEGTGLANCRQRLQHQFGTGASLQLQASPAGQGSCASITVSQAPTQTEATPA